VIKTFVKIAVGIEHIATGGKFLTRGHENGRASTTPIRGKPSNMEQTCARNGLIGEGAQREPAHVPKSPPELVPG